MKIALNLLKLKECHKCYRFMNCIRVLSLIALYIRSASNANINQ
jgi:hypothetical protein